MRRNVRYALSLLAVLVLTVFLCEVALVTPKIPDTDVLPLGKMLNMGVKESEKFTLLKDSEIENQISVSAKSAILCTPSGIILYEKRADTPLPMASITKLMTAVVALENIEDLKTEVVVSPLAAGVEGSSVYLKAGEKVTYEMLVYSAMLESANDATLALAIALMGDEESFVAEMNRKAEELGMESTSFKNPHGLSADGHYTTARDYARLMSYALESETFCKIIGTKKMVVPSIDGSMTRVLTNHNRLLMTYKGMIGGKTGFTKASGRTLVTAANRDGVTLICVTINASDDWNDHTNLFNRGFSYVESNMYTSDDTQRNIAVAGSNKSIAVKMQNDVNIVTTKVSDTEVKYFLPKFLYAPVKTGDEVGKIVFYIDGEECGSEVLYAAESADYLELKKPGTIEKIKSKIMSIIRK